jgi:hypothetical protein
LTRWSNFLAKKMDCRFKPGNDVKADFDCLASPVNVVAGWSQDDATEPQ